MADENQQNTIKSCLNNAQNTQPNERSKGILMETFRIFLMVSIVFLSFLFYSHRNAAFASQLKYYTYLKMYIINKLHRHLKTDSILQAFMCFKILDTLLCLQTVWKLLGNLKGCCMCCMCCGHMIHSFPGFTSSGRQVCRNHPSQTEQFFEEWWLGVDGIDAWKTSEVNNEPYDPTAFRARKDGILIARTVY